MGQKSKYGVCRLCGVQSALVDSHIIPNFHYKPLKAKEGRFYVISTDPEKKELKQQKGLTEQLLCARCDNEKLGGYEKHLAEVLFGGHPLDGQQDGRVLRVRGYDYQKLKNGLLSILWRMSVTSLTYFEEVRLGEKHDEKIRRALLSDACFAELEYPIMLTAPFFDGQHLGDWILPPDPARVGQNRVYRCLISGLLFTFFVGSAPLDSKVLPFILRQNEWLILKARVEEIPFLADACFRLGRAQAVRDGLVPPVG